MNPIRRRHAACPPLLCATIALAFAAPLAHAAGPKRATGYDQFIVKFKDGSVEHANASQRQQRLDAIGRAQGLHIGQVRRLAVGAEVIRTDRVLTPIQIKRLITTLRADPRVEYAETDTRVFRAFTPDDTHYGLQWNYSDAIAGINAPAAWDVATGAGQVVAVLDTGYRPHADLAANLVAGYDFITSTTTANDGDGRDGSALDPGDWVVPNECGVNDAADSSWHGTHVAGTIAAVTNNADGVAGVAFGAKVQPIRVLGKCGGVSSDINDAIVWAAGGTVAGVAANPTPAKVINLSLGGVGACLTSTQIAINTAVSLGATVIVAAGNDNANAGSYQPASCTNILTVAALDRTGARASYSNYGSVVDIAAPGGDGSDAVYSTFNSGETVPGADSIASRSGTSMAAPHVAGVAALVRSAGGSALTPAQMKTLLENTARTPPVACPQGCGAGLVDAAVAVTAASGPVLVVSDVVATEGDSGTQVYTFQVDLSQPLASNLTFDIATASGTATAGSDFVGRTLLGQVIAAGATTKGFTVTVNGDNNVEDDETFSVNVTNVAGPAVTLVDPSGTGRILNNDLVKLANGIPVTANDPTAGHTTQYLMEVPAGATNLQFAISGGIGDADLYVRFGGPASRQLYDCSPQQTGNEETCSLPAQAGIWYVMLDAYEPYANVALVGSYETGVTLSVGNAQVDEGNSGTRLLTFTVSLSQASGAAITYDIATADGTATAGSDYVASSLVGESIPAGQLSKTFAVTLNGDTVDEDTESLVVNLSNANAEITDAQGSGYILNDDGPRLSVSDAAITEGNSGTKVMTFTISLSKPSPNPVFYGLATANNTATAGSDYVAANVFGEQIPAGQLSKTFAVTLNGDTTVEANEILRLNLSGANVDVNDAQGTGTIINDDGPTLSIADAGFVEGDSSMKILIFTVNLSQASASPVTYDITTNNGTAAAGSDYVANALTGQSIPAGQVSKTFFVTVNGDTAVEGNETFFVNLANASVSVLDGQAKGTITNDDGPVLSVSDASITEGSSGTTMLTFTVSLSQVAPAAVSFDFATVAGTAVAGPDYVPVNVAALKIPAGQLSKLVSVPIKGDLVVEPDETFSAVISMGNVSIKDGVGVGTITNDD